VINKGRIAMVKRVSELKHLFEDLGTVTYTMQIAQDSSRDAEALAGMLRLVDGVEKVKSMGPEKVEICIERNRTGSINRILQAAMDQGYMIVSLAQTEASLEQAMMKLLKEERSDES
jgi:ABC-type multidrug transport system ATPase subunit